MTRIVGIDLSLTAPGLATVLDGRVTTVKAIKTPAKLRDVARLDYLADLVRDWTVGADLVAVEGPSYGSQAGQAGHHERAGAWWLVKRHLVHAGVAVVVIPPKSLKSYATGAGNAAKTAMCMAAARRFPDVDVPDDDNAVDALWLAAMAADALGEPPVAMPAAHRAAIAKVADLAALLPKRGQVLAEVTELLGRHDGSRAASVSMLSGLSRDELDAVGGVPESVA